MIDRFDGPDGSDLGYAITQKLRNAKIDGYPYFRIETDANRAEGIVSGSARVRVEELDQYQPRTKCVELDENEQCLKNKEVKILCTKKLLSLTSGIKMTDAINGSIIYSSQKRDKKEIVFCPDTRSNETTEGLIQSMIDRASELVRLDLAPTQKNVGIALQESRKGLPSAQKTAFKSAIKLSRSNQIASCAAFERLYASAPEARSVLYNTALCAERAGDLNRAIALFTRGIGRYRLSNSPTVSRNRAKATRAARNQIAARER